MCSHFTRLPSTIMMQPQRPFSFHALPHQQQFQQRFFASKGQSDRGHLGASRDVAAVCGSPSKLGGVGYGCDCNVRLSHGLRLGWCEEECEDEPFVLLLLPPLRPCFLLLELLDDELPSYVALAQ